MGSPARQGADERGVQPGAASATSDDLPLSQPLEAGRPKRLGRRVAGAQEAPPAHLERRTQPGRSRATGAVRLGEGQACHPPAPRRLARLHLDGGTHPLFLETARDPPGAPQASRLRHQAPAAATVRHSQAQGLSGLSTRGHRAGGHPGPPPLPGVVLKHFTARDVVSRWDVVEVYSVATARTATDFLAGLQERSPFPLRAIQVDGGSEFMAQFEAACQESALQLFVLPPRSPKLNGHVERAQRTHTEEFWERYEGDPDIPSVRPALRAWEHLYNTFRPHQALAGRTPQEYLLECHPELVAT